MSAATRPSWRGWALLALLAAVAAVGVLAPGRVDARAATATERPVMITAWYRAIGNIDPPRCRNTWATLVSIYRPRIGVVFAKEKQRAKFGCLQGNGYGILRRPSKTSTMWKVVWQGSDPPPCRLITAKMAKELTIGSTCEP